MKMILAVMPKNLSDYVSKKILDSNYRVTKFASTSGFLTGGITTLMIGVENNQVETCLGLIRDLIPPKEDTDAPHPRVTIYVLNIKELSRV